MSTPFYEQSGEDRYGADAMAGDLAERKVAAVCEARNRPVVRFGPFRVSTERAQQMTWPKEVRFMPDFLEFGRAIECQGSNGEYVIFKEEKVQALIWWNTILPVWFGIYNQGTDEVIFADIASVLWAIEHPDTEFMILDADTRYPKDAYKVPMNVLLERKFADAFAAAKVLQEKGSKK